MEVSSSSMKVARVTVRATTQGLMMGRGFAGFDWGGDEGGGAVLTGYSMVAVAMRVASPFMSNKRNRSVSFRIRFTGRAKDSDFWGYAVGRGET